jgi:glyceraldehyde-3-phosphate dehydrogenase (NADP+)
MDIKPLLIGGEWRTTASLQELHSPYTGEPLAQVSYADRALVEEAIAVAASTVAEMRALPRYEIAEALRRLADYIKAHSEEFARTMASEACKPLAASRGEVDRAVQTFTFASEEARRFTGETVPIDTQSLGKNRYGWTERIPRTPLSSFMLGEAFLACGLPTGALQIVPMEIPLIDVLLADERVAMISFTGSAEVGWKLRERAARKAVALELGGSAPVVVDETANIAYSVERSAMAAFTYAGQVCISAQRLLIHERIAHEWTSRFVERAKNLRIGDPLDEKTELSAMIDETAARRAESWISEAVGAGARLLCGGTRRGAVLEATVLTDVHSEMRVCSEEIFAPVATIQTFSDFNNALTEANNTRYGLQAGVFTRDMGRTYEALRTLEFGGVMINDAPAFRVDNMPYGGVKLSGAGREGVRYAMEEMTEPRLVVIDPTH